MTRTLLSVLMLLNVCGSGTLDFADIVKIAEGRKLPLVVFINVPDQLIVDSPEWISVVKTQRDQEPLIIVNTIVNGKLKFRAWVSPGIGAEQVIRNVLR